MSTLTQTGIMREQGEDVAWLFARHLVRTRFEDIPEADREAAKKNIIDTLACTLTGYQDLASRAVVEMMVEQGGREEATIIGSRKQVPASSAAFANGTLARAFDFDDCHEESATHTSVSVVPPALAMAERKGGITGAELITTVAVANDLIARLSLAACCGAGPGDGLFAPSMLYGTFGAAAAAGRVLGLDETQMVHALSIALTRTSGSLQYTQDNGAYHINFGFLCQVGVLAALMANNGIYFTHHVFQGKQGLFNMYKRGDYREEELVAALGERFEGSNVSIKPYPSCKHTHTTISATLEAKERYGFLEEEIESIFVYGNQTMMEMSRNPKDIRFDPDNRYEARAGLEKLVATAIVKGNVDMEDMTGQTLNDPIMFSRISSLAPRVVVKLDPELDKQYTHGAVSPSIVRIRTKDGQELIHRTDYVKGHPRNAMSLDDCLEKFKSCAPYAQVALGNKRIEEITDRFSNLETLQNTDELVKLLA
jgi:2-methylcitrate dehydratase PrpD